MLWRLIDSDLAAPAYTAACDEAMIMARRLRIIPNSLHLYRRAVPTVSLGYFEKVGEAVDLEAMRRRGVSLVRRVSGGSAIYTDQGQVIYSVVLDSQMVPESPNATFELVCKGVIQALGHLGLAAEFKPVNDVLVSGRKISGSAQTRKWDVVLQHGTLMVDTDFEAMFDVLKPGKKGHGKDSLTSLAKELGRAPSMERVKRALVDGFASAFDVEIIKGALTRYEEKTIEKLMKERYGREDYTFRS
jgi:lipoate---protein ligase